MLRMTRVVLLLLFLLLGALAAHGRTLLAVARDEQRISMQNMGKDVLGTACYLDVTFSGDAKYRPCQDLEIIAEAIEVIYAFAVGLEPTEVAVNRVGCNVEGISVSLGFSNRVANATLAGLAVGVPPPLMTSTLAPFGLTLKSTTFGVQQ